MLIERIQLAGRRIRDRLRKTSACDFRRVRWPRPYRQEFAHIRREIRRAADGLGIALTRHRLESAEIGIASLPTFVKTADDGTVIVRDEVYGDHSGRLNRIRLSADRFTLDGRVAPLSPGRLIHLWSIAGHELTHAASAAGQVRRVPMALEMSLASCGLRLVARPSMTIWRSGVEYCVTRQWTSGTERASVTHPHHSPYFRALNEGFTELFTGIVYYVRQASEAVAPQGALPLSYLTECRSVIELMHLYALRHECSVFDVCRRW